MSDEQLLSYLKNADLLVQPSLYEGFGIPPLEAMSLGTPVLLSDIQVFKEIYSDFPVTYFTTNNSDSLCIELLKLLQDSTPNRVDLSDEQRYKYTYDKTAQLILKTIEERINT